MFIKIYERERKQTNNGMYDFSLKQIVGCRNLTKEQYEELEDYFIENTPNENIVMYNNTLTFEFVNHSEILEDSPLPDGTIINADSFKEISYLVIIGRSNLNALSKRIRVGLYL